jgi:putative ABC transport system permease protein
MIKNYLKIAWRNLWKNKVFSFINVIGLAIGMAACIVIMLFVLFERSFDNFHKKNIYRLNEVQKFEGMERSEETAVSHELLAYSQLQKFFYDKKLFKNGF